MFLCGGVPRVRHSARQPLMAGANWSSHRKPALGCSLSRLPSLADAEFSVLEDGYQNFVSLNRLEMQPSLFLGDVGCWGVARQVFEKTDRHGFIGTLSNSQNACGVIPLNLALVDRHAQPPVGVYRQVGIAGQSSSVPIGSHDRLRQPAECLFDPWIVVRSRRARRCQMEGRPRL